MEQPETPAGAPSGAVPGALQGIRVLACTQIVAGPFGGVVLSDLGAEVVKLEPPSGDNYRTSGAVAPLEGKRFQSLNRGQQSLAIDLSTEAGRQALYRILPTFDVILLNYRPGIPERLGIGYETLVAVHPQLIYCNITGWGDVGPWASKGATDLTVSAYAGLLVNDEKINEDGEPQQVTPAITDYVTGLACAATITAALYHRERTGEGQRIDASLLRSALAIQDFYVMHHPLTDAVLRDPMLRNVREARARGATYREILKLREEYRWAGAGPPRLYYNGYNAADGQIVLGCLTRATREGARLVLGMEHDRSDDDGFEPWLPENLERIRGWKDEVAGKIRQHPVAYWIEAFDAVGVPVAPVQIPEELVDDPQVTELGLMIDLEHPITGPQRVMGPIAQMSRTPMQPQGPSPILGQHTVEVLRAGGLSDEEIATLRKAGAIYSPEP